VHDPVGPGSLGRPAAVEDERLLHPGGAPPMVDLPVLARGLPVALRRGAVGPVAGAPAPAILRSRRAKKYHWASRLRMREREGSSQDSRQ
jgi:hypothetical protein